MITLTLTEIELESVVRLYGALLSSGADVDMVCDIPVIESIYYQALELQEE